MPPLISVILPVYQAERTVARAVKSILDQTYPNLELIVVDDGSTDRTAGIVDQLFAQTTVSVRTRLIGCSHAGVVQAANRAIEATEGQIIARMDGDDWSHPERLRKQYELLEAQSLDLVGSHVAILASDGSGQVATLARYQNWINSHTSPDEIHAMRFVEYPLANPTIMGRRCVFELRYREGHLDDSLFPEDYEWFLRAMHDGARVAKVPEVLLHWMDSDTRLTRTSGCYDVSAFDACRRHYLLRGPLAVASSGRSEVDLWGAGQAGKPWLRWLNQYVSVRHLYDIDPKKIGQRIHGVTVSHPDEMPVADGTPLIIAVGAAGARELISIHLSRFGYLLGRDSWFVC